MKNKDIIHKGVCLFENISCTLKRVAITFSNGEQRPDIPFVPVWTVIKLGPDTFMHFKEEREWPLRLCTYFD